MTGTIIKNARVFDGERVIDSADIAIDNGIIVDSPTMGSNIVDGTGCTLLPGLIDSHVHLYDIANLKLAVNNGVTTMLDMGTRSPNAINQLKNKTGLPDIFTSYSPAFAPNSKLAIKMGFSESSIVSDVEDSVRFVKEQVAEGARYIKVIIEDIGLNDGVEFPENILKGITNEAHNHDKLVISHVVSENGFKTAIKAGVDILTHVPVAKPLSKKTVEIITGKKLVSIPTLYVMKGIVELIKSKNKWLPVKYKNLRKTAASLYNSNATILCGTDSNMNDPTTPVCVTYGSSIFDELELLVDAGLSQIEALQSATSSPARIFDFADRGVIEVGKRADLILVNGDPTAKISAIRSIKSVWVAGVVTNLSE
ncbi:MAG: amidohydrolase family protein [Eubacteriaceae bacterium]